MPNIPTRGGHAPLHIFAPLTIKADITILIDPVRGTAKDALYDPYILGSMSICYDNEQCNADVAWDKLEYGTRFTRGERKLIIPVTMRGAGIFIWQDETAESFAGLMDYVKAGMVDRYGQPMKTRQSVDIWIQGAGYEFSLYKEPRSGKWKKEYR